VKPRFILMAALAAFSLLALADTPARLPAPWILAGKTPQNYSTGIDPADVDGVHNAKFLRHEKGDGSGWATLMQQISAENYVGKRVRFSARVKTQDISNWAGLWLRVDLPGKPGAAFYNSADKPIKGSTGWQQRSVVLDVPADARVVAFGVIGSGTGEVWLDALALEVVGGDVPVDVMPGAIALPAVPSL
jgi:hypothetical protein